MVRLPRGQPKHRIYLLGPWMMPCQQALKPSLLARELLPVPQTHPWRGQEFRHEGCCCCQVTSVVSDSVRPQRRHPTRLPHPWDSPGKNTGVGCHFLLQCMKVKSESEVAQSCLTLSNPVDCSLPGSSIRGILQARVLEWGAIAFSMNRHELYIKQSIKCME